MSPCPIHNGMLVAASPAGHVQVPTALLVREFMVVSCAEVCRGAPSWSLGLTVFLPSLHGIPRASEKVVCVSHLGLSTPQSLKIGIFFFFEHFLFLFS